MARYLMHDVLVLHPVRNWILGLYGSC